MGVRAIDISPLVVIRNLHIVRAIPAPSKTDAPLLIDPNTVLSLAVSRQALEPVTWEHCQSLQRICGIQDAQPFFRLAGKGTPLADDMPLKELFRVTIMEALDHALQ